MKQKECLMLKQLITLNASNRLLLIIAHPDDEAMFFSPLLIFAKEKNIDVSILCLSTGKPQ